MIAPAPRTVLDQHWPIPGGEVVLTITTTRPLPADGWTAIGPVAAEIGKLVASLGDGEPGDHGEVTAPGEGPQ